MSHHDHHDHHEHEVQAEQNPADARADAIAMFAALTIAVTGILYFISQHGA